MDNQVENNTELETNKKISKKLSWVIVLIVVLNVSLVGSLYYVTSKIDLINIHLNENSACALEKEEDTTPVEDPGIEIFNKEYYQANLITVDSYDAFMEQHNEYLLYFQQSDCSFCKQSNIDIDNYMTKGYGSNESKLPLYFVDRKTASFLFEKYEIETTPTLVYVQGDSEVVYKGMVEVNGFIENKILENMEQEN